PGGYNPALSEIVRANEGLRMYLTDVEVLRLHYAYTLQHWYDRTTAAREAIHGLPAAEWKARYQTEATQEQLDRMAASMKRNAGD
ncbi:DUF1244 domain-containing protein, partial [Enterococcus faecium]